VNINVIDTQDHQIQTCIWSHCY